MKKLLARLMGYVKGETAIDVIDTIELDPATMPYMDADLKAYFVAKWKRSHPDPVVPTHQIIGVGGIEGRPAGDQP